MFCRIEFPAIVSEFFFLGFKVPTATLNNGKRFSPSDTLKKHKNLVVRTNTLVEKVLLRDNFEAYAVKYSYLGNEYFAPAKKGIVLSAGVIGTPKILQLSGIGDPDHLKSVGINARIDLPQVGRNLQDHITTGFDLVTVGAALGLDVGDMLSAGAAWDYFVNRRGPWTTIGCENVAFFNGTTDKRPELQFMVLPLGVSSDNGTYLRTLANIDDSTYDNYFAKVENVTTVTILPILLHPRSRGWVKVTGNNPRIQPLIEPNYLSDHHDIDVLIKGIGMIKDLLLTPPMVKLGARLNRNILPGCESFRFDTSEYWECYVRHLTLTSYHPVGTCAMGRVVDWDFRVMGTSGLYVVDGSILPDLPSGNPNGVIMVMGEIAADVIKGQQFMRSKRCGRREVLVPPEKCDK